MHRRRPRSAPFYLQARAGKQLISIAMEKLQANQLAEEIDEILDQLMTIEGNPFQGHPANGSELHGSLLAALNLLD